MSETFTQIKSGQFGDPAAARGYRFERLGEVFVERIVWGRPAFPRRVAGLVVADDDFIWYRFWLLGHDQVVERYYTADGTPLGTQIDLCAPLVCDGTSCSATDLILDIWIDQAGQVTVHNEDAFERAVFSGTLSPDLARLAETHLRDLTTAIARGRFPPPLVRNWQVGPTRSASSEEQVAGRAIPKDLTLGS